MLNLFSSMLRTSKLHPFFTWELLGNSLINGNLMKVRVTSVEWTWLGLEWHLA